MADRIEAFTTTVTAGTLAAVPAVTGLPFRDGIVRQIDVRIPPGPSGLMGFVIAYAGVGIIPDTASTWLVMDNERWSFTVDDNPTGGQWEVIAYNTDVYDHSIYTRFHIDEFRNQAPAGVTVIPIPMGG